MRVEEAIAREFLKSHPVDAARVLESLPASDLADLLVALPTGATSELLQRLAPISAAKALALIPAPSAARALESMRPDAVAAVLRVMNAPHRAPIVDSVSPERRKQLERLLRYHRAVQRSRRGGDPCRGVGADHRVGWRRQPAAPGRRCARGRGRRGAGGQHFSLWPAQHSGSQGFHGKTGSGYTPL